MAYMANDARGHMARMRPRMARKARGGMKGVFCSRFCFRSDQRQSALKDEPDRGQSD